MQELKTAVSGAVKTVFGLEMEIQLSRPEEKFGDYSTNVALQIAGQLQQNPREVAQRLADSVADLEFVSKVEIAGPGFINFSLTDAALAEAIWRATDLPKTNDGQEILVEFGDPNPFKEMHIGHLYSYIVGDSIAKLLESTGATVRRLSYHGDVGLHVAKAIWGMKKNELFMQKVNNPHETTAGLVLPRGKVELGEYYAAGAKAYDENDAYKNEIENINDHIYKKDDEIINKIYVEGKRVSFFYFDRILNDIEIKTDKKYYESQSASTGTEFVRQHIGSVFTESQGAVIYEGEKVGLHTRVFITSKGLPTYETKDLGLAELKKQDYPQADRSIIITAHEQSEYFKVMLAALREFDRELADKTTHLSHGFLSLSSGKMSSRTGEVFSAISLLNDVQTAVKSVFPDSDAKQYLAAVKYGFLKHRVGTDIVYDVEESVSLEGNSGPYLQYAHARACAVLAKAGEIGDPGQVDFDEAERSLARKISEYPETVAKATQELMPHHIAGYLYELAQVFNRFYETSRIIGDERQNLRLKLTKTYQAVLNHGLGLLNITAPEHV